MDKTIITGATGFVSRWMHYARPSEIDPFPVNRKLYNMRVLKHAVGIKYVVHLAPIEPKQAIFCAKRNNARLLYCSSGIVYHPEWDTKYRQNKIKWEQECLDSGVDVVIARLFTFYGDGLDENKAVYKFTQAAKNNLPIHVTGGGKTIRSYMHGSDLGEWMWAILLNGKSGEAYDVGSDVPINMFDLACLVRDSCGSSSEIIVSDEPDPMPHYLPPNTAKTKSLLTI